MAGVLGGNPSMPAGMPDHHCPFIAAVDCALIPAEVTGVAWPRDGHLLFFGDVYDRGEVRYLPAGTAVTERRVPGVMTLVRRDLRLSVDISLAPLEWGIDFDDDDLDDIDELGEAVAGSAAGLHSGGPLQIGGYPPHWNDPPPNDRIVLASWSDSAGFFDLPSAILYWRLGEADLLARRFQNAQQSHDASA
ncbi:hypothetical protein Q0Z83_025060 [Actinoplanes sichuanensis]|nr:hypothetical protein Q0Z83_025060 [Actinoplanes sichuanensis]